MKNKYNVSFISLLLLSYPFMVSAELKKNLNGSIDIISSSEQSSKSYTVPLSSKIKGSVSNSNPSFYKQGEVSKSQVVIDREFDKHKLMRCWQDGRLIVTENGWDSNSQLGSVISTKGNQKMRVYSFDNTFCVYLGD